MCTKHELIFLAKGLTTPKEEIEGKSHLSLMKHVSKFIESMKGLTLGDKDKSIGHLFKILQTIESLRTSFREDVPIAERKEDTTPPAADEPDKKPLQSAATKRKENASPTPDVHDAAGNAYIYSLFTSIREFKILGSIGKANEKDKLTFGGLSLQIKQAEAKRVNEGEIVIAMIRAMSSSLNLRRMLEVMGNSMSLNKLKSLLRAHYEEPRAVDIHKELQNLCLRPG